MKSKVCSAKKSKKRKRKHRKKGHKGRRKHYSSSSESSVSDSNSDSEDEDLGRPKRQRGSSETLLVLNQLKELFTQNLGIFSTKEDFWRRL